MRGAGFLAIWSDIAPNNLTDYRHWLTREHTTERVIPAHRLHYWQLCDGPTERPATTEEMMYAARYERMFPGEGAIDLVSLTRAIPVDIAVSIEVPTAELAKTVDAKARARRARSAQPEM